MANYEIQAQSGHVDLTPYYMATLACDIFRAAKSPDSEPRHTWYKYFLYCVTIELGLKAALLNNNNTTKRKKKNRKIGHDLCLLREEVAERLPPNFFDATDEKAIDQISKFFSSKSLEYVSGEFLQELVSGGKDLPSIADLEAAANKVVEYMEESRFFVSSDTPH